HVLRPLGSSMHGWTVAARGGRPWRAPGEGTPARRPPRRSGAPGAAATAGRPAPASPAAPPSHLLHAARLAAGQVDAELLGGPEDLVVGLPQLNRHPVAGEHLDVEAQRLQLLEQHLERLRDAGRWDVLPLADRPGGF